jgi:hypothetical protein
MLHLAQLDGPHRTMQLLLDAGILISTWLAHSDGKTMRIRSLLAAMALTPLAACAGEANTHSPDYGAGYSDGCASGSSADSYPRGRKIRDEQAFRDNADYKAGWRSGYNACVVKGRDNLLGRDRERF